MNNAALYLQPLLSLFAEHADAENAKAMAKYMRDQFAFFGIKSPKRKVLLRQFIDSQGLPSVDILPDVARALWQQPQRECQYAALSILYKMRRRLPPEIITLYEELATTKSWWDTIDELAGRHIGEHFQRYPDIQSVTLPHWRHSDNDWLRRVAILFQLHYKQKTNPTLLFSILEENLGSTEFFINKAIGWALREYSKTDATAVINYVQSTPGLAPLSQRQALKWLKNQGRLG